MFRHAVPAIAIAVGTAVSLAAPCARALQPADIVVLYNPRSVRSENVAKHYMAARNIPADNLLPVNTDTGEIVPEETYRHHVVPNLRKALAEKKLEPKCLVTTFDMPLRIGPYNPTNAEIREAYTYQKQLDAALADMQKAITTFDNIAPSVTQSPTTLPTTRPSDKPTRQMLIVALNKAANAAAARAEAAPDDRRKEALTALLQTQREVAGLSGVLSVFAVREDAPGADRGHTQLNALRDQLTAAQKQMQDLLDQRDQPAARQQLIDLAGIAYGTVGKAAQLEDAIGFIKPEESSSCFDNELALLLADQRYSRNKWILNPQNVEYFPTLSTIKNAPKPLLIVTRLDGITDQRVNQMIDTTIEVEKKGLEGKIYLDARGLYGNDFYSQYDADIRTAAAWLKEHADIPVVLDDKPAMFVQADSPDAALYCGWYNLGTYQPVCQWVKGAVGFHVASIEMMSIRQPGATYWVVNLLNNGFCGTLGPTEEPYLTTFPKPSLFFPLLLSGEFTQGEVWQITSPCVGWRQGFVGDPLYNPFKVKPRVKLEDLKAHTVLRNAFTILRPEPAK